jgi:hypothetical protein
MLIRQCLVSIAIAGIASAAYAGTFMCPDGSYVSQGPSKMCPNGRHIGGGGACQMAPDGSYVPRDSESPRMTPNGNYVQGGQGMKMCPDGSYVARTRCVMTPNGKYVGQ